MKTTLKTLLSILCFFTINLHAQLYLDFGKTNTNASYYHFEGGQNANILSYGTFYGISHDLPTIGLDRDDLHAISEIEIENGHFLALFTPHARYIKHIYFHTSKNSVIHQIITDTNYFYVFMEIEDSLHIYNEPTYYPQSKQYALLKFNQELKLVKSKYFDYDTATSWNIYKGGTKLILSAYYNSIINLTIQGESIQFPKPKTQWPNNNYDQFILSFDTGLNFENYGAIEGSRNTRIVRAHISKSNQVSFVLATDRYADLRYGNDTIQKDTNIGYGINPAVLWLDENLQLKRHWSKRDNDIQNITYASFNDNGNFAMLMAVKFTSSTSINRIQLRDSLGNFITNLDASYKNSGTLLNCPEAMGDYFAINSANYTWNFKDTSIFANSLSRFLVTADSLHFVSVDAFGGEHISGISSQSLDHIFGELKYSEQIVLDTLNGKMPAYKVGTILKPGTLFYGIFKYTKDCIPVKASIAYDTMTVCADKYGMWGTGQGAMQVNYSGTGASFQWYMDPNFVLPLNDHVSPLQGGIRQEGTQTNVMTRTFGYTKYNVNRYLVRVNGACTEPFFVDTIYHQVWGTPTQRLEVSGSLKAEIGDTVEIRTTLNDEDYPLDSLIFQWYKGNVALQNGNKYANTNTQNLTIYNVSAFDAFTYSCKIERVHCREVNTQPKFEVYLTVLNTIGLANIEKIPVHLAPNPAKNQTKILMDNMYTGEIKAINSLGQSIELNCSNNKINTAPLVPGIYFLTYNYNGFTFTSKLIIE